MILIILLIINFVYNITLLIISINDDKKYGISQTKGDVVMRVIMFFIGLPLSILLLIGGLLFLRDDDELIF